MEKDIQDNKELIFEPIAERRNEDASEILKAIQMAVAAYLAVFTAEQLPVIS